MAKNQLIQNSPYSGGHIILVTKHAKSIAIAPIFMEKLNACVLEYYIDTDLFGTFTGEIERQGSALESARKKCEWAFNKLGPEVEYVLSSEGSFGPDPYLPFQPCDHEILYFIDRKRDFHFHLSCLSEKTNYRISEIDSLEALRKFANQVKFPSHGLILRPNVTNDDTRIYKGITAVSDLDELFKECQRASSDGKVRVETDMRANFNPTRMSVIAELAEKLAEYLATNCPKCQLPGWGKVRQQKGLPCEYCDAPTEAIKYEVLGCAKCDYEEIRPLSESLNKAEQRYCGLCNP